MTYHRQFFIGNKYMGTAEAPSVIRGGRLCNQQSSAIFCSLCGDIWARFPVTHPVTQATQPWFLFTKHCEKHSHYHNEIPGSTFLAGEGEINSHLPDDMIYYEFHQGLKFYERLYNDDSN